MIKDIIPELLNSVDVFESGKNKIITKWVTYQSIKPIFDKHNIDAQEFKNEYAAFVFEYFIAVIHGEVDIGDCPVMRKFLGFIKHTDISVDELFMICSHFRKAMLDYSYDTHINSKALFSEIYYIFDENFAGLLRMYSDTIYQKERELAENTQLLNEYKNAIDQSALVFKINKDGTINYVNENLEQLSGYTDNELIGELFSKIFDQSEDDTTYEQVFSIISQQRIFKGVIQSRKKNSDIFYMDSAIIPILNTEGDIERYIAISYDVSNLVNARTEAISASAAKDYFLSNMSHEIRTPLNAILGFVTLLQDEEMDERHKKYLDIIFNSGENLLSIINDILDFSKLRSGEYNIEYKDFNLHEEISHTAELFVASASEKSITLSTYLDPKIPSVINSAPLRIKQILSNFISNALKFTPADGSVEVTVSFINDSLNINVKDTGVGIDEENLDSVFNAFTQVDNQLQKLSDGTGLGLSICKKLAEHMNAKVSVRSIIGEGSTFTLSIPVGQYELASAVHQFDSRPFVNLRLALYNRNELDVKMQFFERYLSDLEMNYTYINSLENLECDVLIFVDSDLTKKESNKVVRLDIPAIAIMDYFDDTYDDVENVTPIFSPFYCSKIYQSFLDALQLSVKNDEKIVREKTMKQFDAKILVAEDNEANQELIKIVLARYGIDFEMCENGQEAVDMYKRHSFDMLLMDEQMPVKTGSEASFEIITYEEDNALAHTPIVTLTANVFKNTDHEELCECYDDFLGKPLSLKEFEKVIGKYLKETSPENDISSTEAHCEARFIGINERALKKDLLLEHDQLLMLLEVFIKKMDTTFPLLRRSIEVMNFEDISALSHSIKGSSSNFRLENIQNVSKEIEVAARNEDENYDYMKKFTLLEEEYNKINILYP